MMSDDNAAAARTPADFLKSIKGKPVVVKLNSGVDYRGMSIQRWVVVLDQLTPLADDSGDRRDSGLPRRIHEHCHGANRSKLPSSPPCNKGLC